MRTIQMTLDDDLVRAVDSAARKLGATRSAFAREALRRELDRLRVRELEERHRRGYERKPARAGEFGAWHKEQKWGDE